METHLLPLSTPPYVPHIPILASTHIATAARTILLLGEATQDLGIFALRIIGGHGGINAGSAVDFVKYAHSQESPDGGRTAVILANCGQLRWNRRQGRAMTRVSWDSQTRESAVHDAPLYDPSTNTVEGTRDQKEHIRYILSIVVPMLCKKGVKVDVIAIADSARYVCEVLDENWEALGATMQSLAVVFPFHERGVYQDAGFRGWLEERGRGYVMSEGEGGKGVFGPEGGREAWQWGYGMNVYGVPVEVAEESVFPRHFRGIVDWMGEVARDPEYVNEQVVAVDVEVEKAEEGEGEQWGEELVGAEIWETEAGRAQLRGDMAGEVLGEVTGEDQVEAEKVDMNEGKKIIEGVNEGEVEAQPDKAEPEEDTEQPQKENTKEDTVQSENEVTAQTETELEEGTEQPQKENTNEVTAQSVTEVAPELPQQVKKEAEKDTQQPQKENTKDGTLHPQQQPTKSHTAHPSTDTTAHTLTEVTRKLTLLGYDGAADEPSVTSSTSTFTSTSTATSTTNSAASSATSSNSIPPERMERLPSYVETDEGEPRVKLSREEKERILQITVLSSPGRGGGK